MMRIRGEQRHTSISNLLTDKVNVPAFLGLCWQHRRHRFVIGTIGHATVRTNGQPDLAGQCQASTVAGSLGARDR